MQHWDLATTYSSNTMPFNAITGCPMISINLVRLEDASSISHLYQPIRRQDEISQEISTGVQNAYSTMLITIDTV